MNSSQTIEPTDVTPEIPDSPSSLIDAQPPDSPSILDTSENDRTLEQQDSLHEDEDDFEETTPTNERSP